MKNVIMKHVWDNVMYDNKSGAVGLWWQVVWWQLVGGRVATCLLSHLATICLHLHHHYCHHCLHSHFFHTRSLGGPPSSLLTSSFAPFRHLAAWPTSNIPPKTIEWKTISGRIGWIDRMGSPSGEKVDNEHWPLESQWNSDSESKILIDPLKLIPARYIEKCCWPPNILYVALLATEIFE